jgi:hypothetical protein
LYEQRLTRKEREARQDYQVYQHYHRFRAEDSCDSDWPDQARMAKK